jgi:hypothetical protein
MATATAPELPTVSVRPIPSTAVTSDYVSERELAAELNISLRTLRRWRVLRIDPPITKVGRTVLYSKTSIARWLEARTAKPCRVRTSRRRSNA